LCRAAGLGGRVLSLAERTRSGFCSSPPRLAPPAKSVDQVQRMWK
jgi:hypothetical protein